MPVEASAEFEGFSKDGFQRAKLPLFSVSGRLSHTEFTVPFQNPSLQKLAPQRFFKDLTIVHCFCPEGRRRPTPAHYPKSAPVCCDDTFSFFFSRKSLVQSQT